MEKHLMYVSGDVLSSVEYNNGVKVMVFNTTFNNILVISWRYTGCDMNK
jgi:hypothetical protein